MSSIVVVGPWELQIFSEQYPCLAPHHTPTGSCLSYRNSGPSVVNYWHLLWPSSFLSMDVRFQLRVFKEEQVTFFFILWLHSWLVLADYDIDCMGYRNYSRLEFAQQIILFRIVFVFLLMPSNYCNVFFRILIFCSGQFDIVTFLYPATWKGFNSRIPFKDNSIKDFTNLPLQAKASNCCQ